MLQGIKIRVETTPDSTLLAQPPYDQDVRKAAMLHYTYAAWFFDSDRLSETAVYKDATSKLERDKFKYGPEVCTTGARPLPLCVIQRLHVPVCV